MAWIMHYNYLKEGMVVKQRPEKSYPVCYTFLVSYFVNKRFEVGIVQAFDLREGQLFVLVLEEERNDTTKTRWLPAICCKCRKFLEIKALHEIMERDGVGVEDIKVIEDFKWKYEDALQRNEES
jgi:hypothetical protein